MRYAVTRGTRQLVVADDADRLIDYVCPTCSSSVSLRSGTEREAHFAHMPGQGKPDCEDYHPSASGERFGADRKQVRILDDAPDQLRLGLEVTSDDWTLFVRVPEIPSAELQGSPLGSLRLAQVVVRVGDDEVERVPALEMRPGVGVARAVVPPASETYELAPTGTWPATVSSDRWRTRSSGLRPRGTVFRMQRGEWIRLRDASALECSETLYVVADCLEAPPAAASPCVLGLTTSRGKHWRAWRIVLPSHRHDEVVAWLRSLELDLVEASWKATILNVPDALDATGMPGFHAGNPIAFRFRASDPDETATVAASSDSSVVSATVQAASDGSCFAELATAAEGTHVVTVEDRVDSRVPVRVLSSAKADDVRVALARMPRLRVRVGLLAVAAWGAPLVFDRPNPSPATTEVELNIGPEDIDVPLVLDWFECLERRRETLSRQRASQRLRELLIAPGVSTVRVDAGAFGVVEIQVRQSTPIARASNDMPRTARWLTSAIAANHGPHMQPAFVQRQAARWARALLPGALRGLSPATATMLRWFARATSRAPHKRGAR